MSEPTLYRIEYRKPNEPDTFVSILQDGGLLVPVEPDVQAAIDYRHMYGRPKCYDGLDEGECQCRGSVMGIVEALGIGGDDG